MQCMLYYMFMIPLTCAHFVVNDYDTNMMLDWELIAHNVWHVLESLDLCTLCCE